MATVTLAYNHSRDPMNPDHLARQIQGSLSLASPPDVQINPTQIIVTRAGVTETNRAAIQTLIDAYVYDAAEAKLPPGNEGVLRSKITAALTANQTFLAIPSPNAAQTLTQVQRLTRQMDAALRLLDGRLDDVSDT